MGATGTGPGAGARPAARAGDEAGAGAIELRPVAGEDRSAAARGADDRIHMIVARSTNGVIGRDGDMPWRLRGDLQFFRKTTMGNTIVMGRKTFESIGKPLPNRKNVVITRDRDFRTDGVTVVHSPEAALDVPRQGELFVIGGQQIYEAFLPRADVVYVTMVDAHVDGDTRFPELGPEWKLAELSRHETDEHNDYAFAIYRAERRDDCGPE